MQVSRARARTFLLQRQGLLGPRRFQGKAGVLALVRQWGCLQFDPVNVCGRAPEISLLARVEDYRPAMLDELLYQDRSLFDYLDKEQGILPIESWPMFARRRRYFASHWRARGVEEDVAAEVLEMVREQGPVSSADIDVPGRVEGYWSVSSTIARMALEANYVRGSLVIHHKVGVRKYYDLASRHVPAALLDAPDPFPHDADYLDAKVLQRIRGIGLLWPRSGSAWLGCSPDPRVTLKAADRLASFARLVEAGLIEKVEVDGVATPVYCATEDLPLLAEAEIPEGAPGPIRLLGPLDTMMWDRTLISALFGFDYTWEIYTPAVKRQYAAYTLPMIEGDNLVGRVSCRRVGPGEVALDQVWYEPGWRRSRGHAARLREAVHRLGRVN